MANILMLDSNGDELKHLYQWDTDRVIEFRGVDPFILQDIDVIHVGLVGHPNATEAVPFSGTGDNSIIISLAGWKYTRYGQPLVFYIYQHMGAGQERTIHEVQLPVLRRNKPIPYSDAEWQRQQAELGRENAENIRIDAETQREINEAQRIANENERELNEAARQKLAGQMQQALDDVSGAVEDAQEAIEQAEAATTAANAAVETANVAVETANAAAERATEAASAAEGVIADAQAATSAATEAAEIALAAAGSATAQAAEAAEAAQDAHDAAAEARAAVGDLNALETVDKSSLVGAVNEVHAAVENVYTKSETDAKIVDALANFDKLDYEIVDALPTEGKSGVRYLVKHPTDNQFEEYIYIDGAWYDVGSTADVDLSNYYDKAETNSLLDVTLKDYATKQYVNNADSTLATAFESKITAINTEVAKKASAEYVDDELAEKQNTLVSGVNIKTLGGETLLGSGDIVIKSAPSGIPFGYYKDQETEITLSPVPDIQDGTMIRVYFNGHTPETSPASEWGQLPIKGLSKYPVRSYSSVGYDDAAIKNNDVVDFIYQNEVWYIASQLYADTPIGGLDLPVRGQGVYDAIETVVDEDTPYKLTYGETSYADIIAAVQRYGSKKQYILIDTTEKRIICSAKIEQQTGSLPEFIFETATYQDDTPSLVQYRLVPAGWTKTLYPIDGGGSGDLPAGGATNAALVKASDADGDVKWGYPVPAFNGSAGDMTLANMKAGNDLASLSAYFTDEAVLNITARMQDANGTALEAYERTLPTLAHTVQLINNKIAEIVGSLSDLQTDDKSNSVSAINELNAALKALGEPFRVKEVGIQVNAKLPFVTEDIPNTDIPNIDIKLSDAEVENFAVVGLLKFEVWDAASGGNRLNCVPVAQFSMTNQTILRLRFMCAGTGDAAARKTARRITGAVLLKHR